MVPSEQPSPLPSPECSSPAAPAGLRLLDLSDARAALPVDPARATRGQLDGWECALCGRDLIGSDEPGIAVRVPLFACRSCVMAYARGLADAIYGHGALRHLERSLVVALVRMSVRNRHRRP